MGAVPLPNRNGSSGQRAPRANATNDETAATHGEPERRRVEAELLAGERVERDVLAAHDRVDERARRVGRDALGPVDHLELVALLLRERAQLLLLDAQLVLVELALRPDRDPLPRRHRERAGHQPGDAGEHHDAVVRWCRRRRPSPARSSTPGRRSRRTRRPAARRRSRPGGDPPSGRCGRPRGCPASRRWCGRRPLLLRHRVGGFGVVAVAVGLGRLGAQHQRQHRLGAEVPREEAQRPHAERQPRACAARRRPRAAAAPSARRGVPRRPRAAGTRRVGASSAYSASPRNSAPPFDLVGVHLAQSLRCARASRRSDLRRHHADDNATQLATASVADFPETQSLRCAYPSCRVAVARAQDAEDARPGGACPIADVDQRADDRAHHLPAERGGA